MSNEQELIRHLTEALSQKDGQIEDLKNELRQARYLLSADPFVWALPGRSMDAREDLPVPRLELVYTPSAREGVVSWHEYRVLYRLVYRHMNRELHAVVFGETRNRGGGWDPKRPPVNSVEASYRPGKLELPIRDGAHIRRDMVHLKLPAFAIAGDVVEDLADLAVDPTRGGQ